MSVVETYATAHALTGAGLVVGSLNDPASIANQHIRIHALEGQLFREVVEQALSASGLPCSVWRERDVYGVASAALVETEPRIRNMVAALGQEIDGPWRAEQKAAAVAAWLVLAGGRGPSLTRHAQARARRPA
jgi:hypothetical protein